MAAPDLPPPPSPPPPPPSSAGPSGSSGPLTLDHWVYGVTPGKGYSIKSTSRGLNLSFYDERLDGFYTPIRGDSLQDGKVDLVMLHPAPTRTELLFSVVGRGPDDEMGRPTFQNHTIIAPLDALSRGTVTLGMLEQAVRAADAAAPNAVGDTDPITLVPAEPRSPEALTAGLRRCLTPAAAETLVTRMLTAPSGRTLLLCRNSTSELRIRTLSLLSTALHLVCGLPWLVSMSDAPTASSLDHFQLVTAPRGIRADNTWLLLDASLDQPALPRPGGQNSIYDSLSRCFTDG